MSANVETMFYVREAPWHGLGVRVESALNSEDAVELSAIEAEYLGLDMERYRAVEAEDDADSDMVPSSTGGDYSPVSPWDAPGMSASDFV